MTYLDKLKSGAPTLSFEIFPPKNPAGWASLYSTLGDICRRDPDFISVTYGAGGSTRAATVDLVTRIQRELGISAVAHLTCVGHSSDELQAILATLSSAGIGGLMALRGDAPKGADGFTPHPEGFANGSDLIRFARPNSSFAIGCAYYPEKHPEAESLASDIGYLKTKQDAGADFAVSQLFFDNEAYYRFRDTARAAGVTIPLIAGIMPVTGLSQLKRFRQLSGTDIPAKLTDYLGEGADDEIVQRGIDYGTEQCADLLRNGVGEIHLYTLNKSVSSGAITDRLREMGLFADAALA